IKGIESWSFKHIHLSHALRCKAKIPIKGIESNGYYWCVYKPPRMRCKAKIPIKGIERVTVVLGGSHP
ncbi:MAG: hypothetical protein ACP5H3_04340, partial [Candidatus Aenigmatarchaeota archaeon]